MDPISAVSLASSIIQIVDFSSRLLSRTHELYVSVDGSLKEHMIIDNATNNLSSLYGDLQKSNKSIPGSLGLSDADKLLVKLKDESEVVVRKLRGALDKAKTKKAHSKAQSVFQALKSVFTDPEILRLANELDNIGKQVNTALLLSLRNTIDGLAKAQDSGTTSTYEAQQRHDELLNAIRENNWQASQEADVGAFSQVLHSSTILDTQLRFCKSTLARLYFHQMPDRYENIPKAHRDTFDWLFKERRVASSSSSNFRDWLERENSSVYWIAGKPGSGKSTLMKYLCDNRQLSDSLATWAGDNELTRAEFYLWNSSGSYIQMSCLGLLQVLVYNCLKTNNPLLVEVFAERWEQFLAFGGGQNAVELPELKRAFKRIVSDQSKRFFFLIDGLDEVADGELQDIIQLVLDVAHSHVKLCVASRPWVPLKRAFEDRPQLLLEELTEQDISKYVDVELCKETSFVQLQRAKPVPAAALIQHIVHKATGVFLWVRLVVQSLVQGLSNSDSLTDLQRRLDALPGELDQLFDNLLGRLDKDYFKRACETFRLLHAYHKMADQLDGYDPTLLAMYYADEEEDAQSSFGIPLEDLGAVFALDRAQDMRTRVNARCRGFVEVRLSDANTGDKRVGYLHRTARDFIESKKYWNMVLETTNQDAFRAEERWANAHLWIQKAFPFVRKQEVLLQRCVQSALVLQEKTGLVQRTYLDKVCRAQYQHYYLNKRNLLQGGNLYFSLSILADQPALVGYLTWAIDSAPRKERKAALEPHTDAPWRNHAQLSKIVTYYNMSRSLRWASGKPELPKYE